MSSDRLFSAAGDLRPVYEAVDWAGTPLGAPSSWTQTLRAVVETMVRTKFPCTLLWGPDAVLLYNGAYVPILGEKHPDALGRRAEDVFPEAWEFVSSLLTQVRSTGEAAYLRDAPVPLFRDGRVTDSFFTFCYSAVCGDDGQVEGVLDIVSETTCQVLGARRMTLIEDLRNAMADTDDASVARRLALQVLNSSSEDISAAAFVSLGHDVAEPLATVGAEGEIEIHPGPDGSRTARLPFETSAGSNTHERLELTFSPTVEIDDGLVTVIRAIGASISEAVARRALLAAERDVADAARGFSEALQLSLLGEPKVLDGLEIAVRYIPATETASVGGDWYDSFFVPSGALLMAIGDIAGHDREAAVAMSQARSMLRGIAFSSQTTPAQVLTALDRTVSGLEFTDSLTAIVASLDPAEDDPMTGSRTLRWSNGGHPPPARIAPDGAVSFLERTTEPLLGLSSLGTRHDHSVELPSGSTVVFYTDGLVERRTEHLDVGLARLRDTLTQTHDRSPEDMTQSLVEMAGVSLEDDVAIMVVRLGPSGSTSDD